MAQPLRARSTFFWGQRVVNAGEIVSSDDPVAKHAPELFEPIVAPVVEQATAAPGERRNLTRPTRKE